MLRHAAHGQAAGKLKTIGEQILQAFQSSSHRNAQNQISGDQRGYRHRVVAEKNITFFPLVPSLFRGCFFCSISFRHRNSPLCGTSRTALMRQCQHLPDSHQHPLFSVKQVFIHRGHEQHQQSQPDQHL